jgi:predicted Zn-dependent protease
VIAGSDPIGRAFAAESWHEARELILEHLLSEPSSHWLLTRLATTYYETYDYAQALEIAKRAERITPTCPLVLWDVAEHWTCSSATRKRFKSTSVWSTSA